ncbi:MAG: 6-hydroxymethylpterin diphosphokinase MptE-like protein [Candidatus Heimdallarchaeaceae archaeon]
MIFETENSPFKDLEEEKFSQEVWLNYWYPQICEFLELSSEDDSSALKRALSITQSNYPSYGLKQLIEKKKVYAIAPGIHLEEEIETYQTQFKEEDDILISADGATSYLISKDIIPDIIVTDFDGNIDDQLFAQQKGSILLIHVHGDNYQTIQKYLETISKGKFLITTQIEPLPGSYNFYGFTDGDRIVCLASLMSADEIYLIGYDFGSDIGKYSKTEPIDEERKKRKLKKFIIGKSVINWCFKTGQYITVLSDRE